VSKRAPLPLSEEVDPPERSLWASQHLARGKATPQNRRISSFDTASDIKGHRVSDFPHAIYKAGNLGDFEDCPDAGVWILEIQLAHPTRPFGSFYEDLLI
jgi:hypothetical protein